MVMQSTGHFFGQIPQPVQKLLGMTGKPSASTVTVSSPMRTPGQTFMQMYPHFSLDALFLSIIAMRIFPKSAMSLTFHSPIIRRGVCQNALWLAVFCRKAV